MDKITIRSDRDTDYTFMYKGEETTLKAGSIISIANGLNDVVLPTSSLLSLEVRRNMPCGKILLIPLYGSHNPSPHM